MSKSNRYKNSPVTPKDQQSLDKYFCSPDCTKKRKKPSIDSPNSDTPPNKKHGISTEAGALEKNKSKKKNEEDLSTDTYQHIDNKLNSMEKHLEASLSASLSESITKSVTDSLKDIIDNSLKEALDTMSKNVNKAIEENPTVIQHGEQIDSLETENLLLKSKVQNMEGEQQQMKKKLSEIEKRSLQNNLIFRGIQEDEWEKEPTSRAKLYSELAILYSGHQEKNKPSKKMQTQRIEIQNCRRIGRYVKDRSRPLSVEFVRKEDAEFVFGNKKKLREGIYADREYPIEIEK